MNRDKLEEVFIEYRKSIGRSENLDNPAKSLIRKLGEEDDMHASLAKSLYVLGTVDKIERSKHGHKRDDQQSD